MQLLKVSPKMCRVLDAALDVTIDIYLNPHNISEVFRDCQNDANYTCVRMTNGITWCLKMPIADFLTLLTPF